MWAEFIEEQKYFKLLVQFNTFYIISFARYRTEDAVLLQVLVSFLSGIAGDLELKT